MHLDDRALSSFSVAVSYHSSCVSVIVIIVLCMCEDTAIAGMTKLLLGMS